MRPGKVVADRFEIVRVADSGGMGVVYQTLDRASGRFVALKVLLHSDQGPADRFAAEVELLSTLEHPHIVGYVSHGATEHGTPFLVMPWFDGIDLEERLRKGPLSIDDTLTLARRVAEALAYLHGRGLVHRDLKPSNLFLPNGKFENVQVIDLGVARASIASRALTLSGVLIGTPGFIAPEQARGDHDIAPAVDIFAFGCVLFECLTGRRLFSGGHVMSVLAKILLEDAPRVRELRPDAPSGLDLLVHRMVAKDPEKRPRDGTQLAQWLADIERTPAHESQPPSMRTLTTSERRVVTVLVVVLSPSHASIRPQQDETRVEADPLGSAAARFGVRAQLLAEQTAIVLAPEGVTAADQASVLARFAHHVVETFPGACVALTTGSAVTGSPLPAGEALDRAVTLVRKASPETGVLVDEVTAALITARFDIHHEGEKLIVEGERISLDPTRPLLGRPTSCVGREHELAILDATVTECVEGEGPKVVLVTAAAGAGKSRLRHELVRRLGASEPPPTVLQCRGDPLHAATPYAMMAQAVRQAVAIDVHDSPDIVREKLQAHVARLLPEEDRARVSGFLGELVDARFDDSGRLALRAARSNAAAMADQIGRAFEDVLRAWCTTQLVVIVLEDLHWGDAASTRLLDRALRKLVGTNLFVLALARPEVHERFPLLFANRNVTEIHLPPLAKRACAALVHSVMGQDTPVDVGRIVERSEGNAFYLEELIRAAAEPRTSAPTASHGDDLPPTVLALAQARLERLEPDVRKVLRAASVYGDVFWLEGVSALVGETSASLEKIIASLIEHEAIGESERPRLAGVRELAFRHALLRGTAYATLTEEDRALGHRLAAQWLEGVEEDGEVVALHWLEGGHRVRAAASFAQMGETRWLQAQADAAARCATRSLLVSEVGAETAETISGRLRLLARALAVTRSLDAREVLTGLRDHAPILDVNAISAARDVTHAAIERSVEALRIRQEEHLLPSILADAACALAAVGDFTNAKRLLAEASNRAANDHMVLRRISYATARVAHWQNDDATVFELLAETVLPEDPRERLEILLILAWGVVMVDGRAALTRGLDFVSRAEAILNAWTEPEGQRTSSRDDSVARVQCASARGACFYFTGEYLKAAQAAEDAVAIARRAGFRFDEFAQLHNAGEQYLSLGDRTRARRLLLEANEIVRDIGAERLQMQNDILLANLDERPDRLREVAEGARASNDPWLELQARYWLGRLLAPTTIPDARDELERALHLARELSFHTMADDCTRALAALPPSPS